MALPNLFLVEALIWMISGFQVIMACFLVSMTAGMTFEGIFTAIKSTL
jgi:hypothetical protein